MPKKSLDSFINQKLREERKRRLQEALNREWYSLRRILSFSWAIFLFLLGSRGVGKSYAVCHFYVDQWVRKGRPFYWIRLSEASQKKLLMNNAEKLIDPDIRRKYNLDLEVIGDSVYQVTTRSKPGEDGKPGRILEKKLMARVLALSTFYNDKGSGLYDKDFLKDPKMYYNIAIDEMNREQGEARRFDIVTSFVGQMENLVRSTKTRLRIICIGNTLEEASDLLVGVTGFVPETFGTYKIKKKRAVIEYMEPNAKYKERRKGTVADIVAGNHSNFTNKIDVDHTMITKKRLEKPSYVIAFTNTEKFTVWDGNIIAPFHNEKCKNVVAMRPYLDFVFNVEAQSTILDLFDTRSFLFRNLVTQKLFKKSIEILKPRK